MSHFRSISKSDQDSAPKPSNKDSNSKDKQELGNQAVWSLSSAKPGFGVEQLRDNNIETYWQSDGTQPHYVNIQFHKKVSVDEIELYCDMKLDESYTPHKISVRSGTTFNDLKEVKTIELSDPNGWISITLCNPIDGGTLRTNFIQLAILTNHQNGRDSHIRQIRIYGPRPRLTSFMNMPELQSEDFVMYSTVR